MSLFFLSLARAIQSNDLQSSLTGHESITDGKCHIVMSDQISLHVPGTQIYIYIYTLKLFIIFSRIWLFFTRGFNVHVLTFYAFPICLSVCLSVWLTVFVRLSAFDLIQWIYCFRYWHFYLENLKGWRGDILQCLGLCWADCLLQYSPCRSASTFIENYMIYTYLLCEYK